jgi:hemoglobin
LTSDGFDRWITLFHETVDDLFAGSTADHAKQSASRIALALQHNIAADHSAELTNAS